MPLKEDPASLGNSKNIALKRLNAPLLQLKKDPPYSELYKNFLNEHEFMGHMNEVTQNEEPNIAYCMPHHGIYRPQKTITKLRAVSSKSTLTSNGNSLNSILLNGGIIQDDLFSILTRFCKHIYAFMADI